MPFAISSKSDKIPADVLPLQREKNVTPTVRQRSVKRKSSGVKRKGIQMDTALKTSIWQQFGAAIDTLDDTISACPDELWSATLWKDSEDARYGQVWFVAYHTLFWLDLFLTGSSEGFLPPSPFIRGALPEKPYTKDDVLAYLRQCRQKCKAAIEALTDEKAYRVCTFEWMEPTFLELQLYSMRHVQEHAAQLGLFLGQNGVSGPDWIPKAKDNA